MTSTQTEDFPCTFAPDDTIEPPTPESWEPFERLKRLSMTLRIMTFDPRFQTPPPPRPGRAEFLRLVACFSDPTYREILRALILDLLADDLADLLAEDEERTT